MGAAARGAKMQSCAEDVEALWLQADVANCYLQPLAEDWDSKSGGMHHSAPVKSEERGLQKVFRAYQEDWRCLCDLVRTAIVYDSIRDLEKGLTIIASDLRVEMLHVGDHKNRLRAEYDAEANGGYRDLQLSLRITGPVAAVHGFEGHIVEVQLHLSKIYNLKTGGGHRAYVIARNLRGS